MLQTEDQTMEGKLKLSDDELTNVSGGLESIGKRHTVSYEVMIECPKCHQQIRQKFYTDGSVEYRNCPNPKCRILLGVG